MKKLRILNIVCLVSVLSFPHHVLATSNPYPQYFGDQTNCTWYAWKMAYERAGVALPGWGNANTWYESAKNAGYSVGTTPRANSIAIWTKCEGDCATYGHVGYVERVSEDGTVLYIKDTSYGGMNGCVDTEDETYKECIRNGVSEETDRICYQNAPRITCAFAKNLNSSQGFYTGDITQFIYLDDAPKNPIVNTESSNQENKTPEKVETSKQEEPKKSSNTNIKDLSISISELEFSNEKNTYEIEVEYKIDSVEVFAVLEDEKAQMEGNGKHSLEVGKNSIELVVTAEDGTQKTYYLNINRKEEIKTSKPVVKKEKEKKTNQKKDNITMLVSIITGTFIVVITIILLIKKNGKRKESKITISSK